LEYIVLFFLVAMRYKLHNMRNLLDGVVHVVSKENQSENRNFVQLGRQYLTDWRRLIRKKPLAAELLMFLIDKTTSQVGGTNAVVCSYAVFQEITGFGRSSVASALKVLREDNWIQIIKIGTTHAYAVNEKVAWRGAANGREYAIFSATVIGAKSEQDAGVVEDTTKLKRIPILQPGDSPIVGSDELPPPDQGDMDLNGSIGKDPLGHIRGALPQKRLEEQGQQRLID
jgi:hypothetical protein